MQKLKLTENDEKKYAEFEKITRYREYDWEPRATDLEQRQAQLFLEKIAITYPQTVERDAFLTNNYHRLANIQNASSTFWSENREKRDKYGAFVFSQLHSNFNKESDRNEQFNILREMRNFCGYSKEYCGQDGLGRFAALVGDFMKEDDKCRGIFGGIQSKQGCYALAFLASEDKNFKASIYAKIQDKSVIKAVSEITGLPNNFNNASKETSR